MSRRANEIADLIDQVLIDALQEEEPASSMVEAARKWLGDCKYNPNIRSSGMADELLDVAQKHIPEADVPFPKGEIKLVGGD